VYHTGLPTNHRELLEELNQWIISPLFLLYQHLTMYDSWGSGSGEVLSIRLGIRDYTTTNLGLYEPITDGRSLEKNYHIEWQVHGDLTKVTSTFAERNSIQQWQQDMRIMPCRYF
jgi:hypothetical protein